MKGGCFSYLHDLVRSVWMLGSNPERPVRSEGIAAAEAQVHAVCLSELVVAAASQVRHDLRFLLLGEAWACEDSHCKLLERAHRRLGGISASIAVHLAEHVDEGANGFPNALEQANTLILEYVLSREPRILVDRRDQALVGTDEAASSVRGLIE